jgi:hypothetical protein
MEMKVSENCECSKEEAGFDGKGFSPEEPLAALAFIIQ